MLWIRSTGLRWDNYNVFVEALAPLSRSKRSIFTARDCFGARFIISVLLFSHYRCLSQTTVGDAYRLV